MTECDSTPHKKCMKCKEQVPLAGFNKNKSKPDGLGTECRRCANAHSAKYHIENHAAHLERGRAAYQANPEAFKARARKWEADNADRKRELDAGFRERNKEKIQAWSRTDWAKHNDARLAAKRAYRQRRPDLALVHVRNRQTRKQRAMPEWANLDAIKAIYKAAREMTVTTGVKHHVDHFYPLKSPLVCGLHNEFNLRVIAAAENQSKGNRLIDG